MPIVFISYRRSDSQDVTGRIYDRLVAKYQRNQILKDVDNIPLGVSFPKHLNQMLAKADVVLVIIGPTWVNTTDEQGRRRLEDAGDFVRVEVETALRAKIPVVPILVSHARMPSAADLPLSMQKLVDRNGIQVRPDPDFNNDIERLCSGLEHLEKLLSNQKGGSATTEKAVPPLSVPVGAEKDIRCEAVSAAPGKPPQPRSVKSKPPVNKGLVVDQAASKPVGASRRRTLVWCAAVLPLVALGVGAATIAFFLLGRANVDVIGVWQDDADGVCEFKADGTGAYSDKTVGYAFEFKHDGAKILITPTRYINLLEAAGINTSFFFDKGLGNQSRAEFSLPGAPPEFGNQKLPGFENQKLPKNDNQPRPLPPPIYLTRSGDTLRLEAGQGAATRVFRKAAAPAQGP